MADITSVHALMLGYERDQRQLEELRGLLWKRHAAARPSTLRAEIEAALERMDSGRYGTCLGCGAFIPLAQLRSEPHRPECEACGHPVAA